MSTSRPPITSVMLRRFPGLSILFTLVAAVGCSNSQTNQSSSFSSRGLDPYCPILPSRTFERSIVVSGDAVYEYRVHGNGVASDNGVVLNVSSSSTPVAQTYSLIVDGRFFSAESSLTGSSGQKDVVSKLKAAINSDTRFVAYGTSELIVTSPQSKSTPLLSNLIGLVQTSAHPPPRPIRFAEIAVKNAAGEIVQCAETDDFGSYHFQLPANSGFFTIELRSRAGNSRSMAYILDNPMENRQHSLQVTVDSVTDTQAPLLRATVRDDLLGGAFNILDQILKAQDFLRNETGKCNQPGDSTFLQDCVPFVGAPLVKVYWSAGLSPSTYLGTTGSISFYLNGRRELYLQGGQNGNVISSDMDHFDNSVILHEYAHFLEDVFGRPDSPGGSHNGDSIIDPRLAWGEGWANFFQAAVTGDPVYRDTYGTPDCTSACAGTYFDESIDPSGRPGNDVPTQGALGEGNFREFAITRMLWDAIKTSGGVTRFSEIWRTIVAPNVGMRNVVDPFKSVGRFHFIQTSLSSVDSWSALRLGEEQIPGFSVYATRFSVTSTTCATSPVRMTPVRSPGDNGSFATSDQFRNNDFFRFDHLGGRVNLELFYSKNSNDPPDLDLYLYRSKYILGRASDMLLTSAFSGDGCPSLGNSSDLSNSFRSQNGCPTPPAGLTSTFGYEKAVGSLPAGTYMLNVQADTSVRAGAATDYVLLLNGGTVCPEP